MIRSFALLLAAVTWLAGVGQVHHLGARFGVDLPVCAQVDQVINHGAPVRESVSHLMGREATVELGPHVDALGG